MKKFKYSLLALLGIAPAFAFAEVTIESLFTQVFAFLNGLIPFLITLAVIYFIWGVIRYVKAEGDEQEEARKTMLNGIIVLFVIASVWGLVRVLQNTFLDDPTPVVDAPCPFGEDLSGDCIVP